MALISGLNVRIADENLSWQSVCGADVSSWTKTDLLIVAFHEDSDKSHGGDPWANMPYFRLDGGTWTQITTTSTVKATTVAALTDADPVGSTSACYSPLDDSEEDTNGAINALTVNQSYAELQVGLDVSAVGDGVLIEFSTDGATLSAGSITIAAGSTTYDTSLASSLRVNATFDTSLASNLRVKIADIQLSLPSQLKIILTSQIFQPSNLRVKVLAIQKSLASNLTVRVVDNQISLASNLRVSLQSQLSLVSNLRVNATQETFLPSNLIVRVSGNQLTKPSNLRVNITQQLSLPSNLQIIISSTTYDTSLISNLRVKIVDQQLSLTSNLRITIQTQLFQPSNIRVKVLAQQISLPSNLDVRILAQQLSLPSVLKIIVYSTNDVSLASNLRVNAIQEISLSSNLRVKVSDIQKSLPSNLRVMIQTQLYLPSNLRINATQQLSLVSNIDVRVADNQVSLPSQLKVVTFATESVYLPTSLRVRVFDQQTYLSSNMNIRVVDNQLSLPTNLKVIVYSTESAYLPTSLRVVGAEQTYLSTNLRVNVTQQLSISSQLKVVLGALQLSLPTNLRVNVTQQSSLPTNIRVKVLANQLVKSSNLRVALLTQISVPSNLRVKVIGVQIDISTNLRIKVIGQQLSKSTNLKIVLRPQIYLSTNLRVKAIAQQISLPSSLRIITFTGLQLTMPTNLRVLGSEQTILPSCLRVEIPALFTIASDDSDVGIVRKLMAQAGREVIQVHNDDILPVFYSGSDTHLYTDFQDIMDIQHIRLVDDIYHSGTNYLQGSTIYDKEGRIDIGLNLPANTDEILITYATRDGLSDEVIQLNINMAKYYLQGELWRSELNYSGSSTYEIMAKWTLYSIATYWCILGMNSSNAIQSGYNYRIAEFEIQTKLWGEGMIAETLLMKYWERSNDMIKVLKMFESNPEAPIYVVNRSNTKVPYNKDPTIFHTLTNMEAVTLHDSVSRYAVILKIWG